jgi:hypothetical protein
MVSSLPWIQQQFQGGRESGRGRFKVSGRQKLRIPQRNAKQPKMVNGKYPDVEFCKTYYGC